MTLQALFTPRGVALVGSVGEGKLGYELLRQMLAGGYHDVVAVNPKGQGALGVAGYGSIAAAIAGSGLAIDMVVVAAPASSVAGVLEECGQAGVGAAVLISSGFSEMGNKAGEAELKAIAARHGIRLVGPNCAGIINTAHRLTPTLETLPPAGNVAIISQSGAFAGVLLGWAKRDGLGISKFVSYGNRADVNEIHLLEFLADDPETAIVCVYIETVSDGRAFMAAATKCSSRKPVIVIKAGRGESGQRATLSHTGSLAGSDAVYDAALAQCGALRVSTAEEMFDLCRAFTGLPALSGNRVAIVTNSGGPSILAADRAEAVGLRVTEPGKSIKSKLEAFLPPHASLRNPIDLTVEGTERGYREALTALLATAHAPLARGDMGAEGREGARPAGAEVAAGQPFDAAVAINIAPPYLESVSIARGIIAAARATGKAIVTSFLPEAVTADAVAVLAENGVLNFPTPERAVAALGSLVRLERNGETATARAPVARGDKVTENTEGEGREPSRPSGGKGPAEPNFGAARPGLPPAPILEPQAMAWLAANGLGVPPFVHAAGEEEAVAGSRRIGFPVVMKVVSPDILHKSERGGVIVNIGDEAAAFEAFRTIRRLAEGATFCGVVIYPLIRGSQEVLIGLSRDPQFGPVVAFGLGGIYTEVLRDVSLRIAPVDAAEALAMIRSLRGYPILAGTRGQKPCDLDALAKMIARLSELPFEHPEIAEIDLNPVFSSPAGAVAGDVRIILR